MARIAKAAVDGVGVGDRAGHGAGWIQIHDGAIGKQGKGCGVQWRPIVEQAHAALEQCFCIARQRQGEAGSNGWSDQDLNDGFALTGMFLLRHVLEPRGQGHSDAREGFINAVSKHRARVTLEAE